MDIKKDRGFKGHQKSFVLFDYDRSIVEKSWIESDKLSNEHNSMINVAFDMRKVN